MSEIGIKGHFLTPFRSANESGRACATREKLRMKNGKHTDLRAFFRDLVAAEQVTVEEVPKDDNDADKYTNVLARMFLCIYLSSL